MEESDISAVEGKFTIQEDEEQLARLSDILDLLVSAGYSRAKLKGLSAFEKIVGGMVWCICMCAEAVDVDLLYSENSTIGQKIALTENIVKVLPKFKCPHTIEPHQIQGLDCIHIFPVVQWLVKETIFAQERYGDEVPRFAALHFERQGWANAPPEFWTSKFLSARKSRPKASTTKAAEMQNDELKEDLRCALLEYGLDATDVVIQVEGEDAQQPETPVPEIVEVDDDEIRNLEMMNSELAQRLSALESEDKTQSGLLEEAEAVLAELQSRIEEYDTAINAAGEETVAEARRLMAESRQIRADENAYKRECRQQIAAAEAEITQLESETTPQALEAPNLERISELEAELAELNNEINRLSRQVHAQPSQVELNQYQRRFIELYNQVTAKHLEARRLCVYNNSLVDILAFMRKEIALLNNIDDQKNLALSDSYKFSFTQNLKEIVEGINDSYVKMRTKRQDALQRRDNVAHELHALQEKKRMYLNAVSDFQEECQLNEELIAKLEASVD